MTTRRRTPLVITIILLALAAWLTLTPTAKGATTATLTAPTCAGVPASMHTKISYDFNEAPGSTVAHDTLHPTDLAYNLTQPAGYTGVIFTGGTVQFDNHQLLIADGNTVFNPGSSDYFYCAIWRWAVDANGNHLDPDGYNLTQFGRSVGTNEADHPLIKMMPGYVANHGTTAGVYATPPTHGASSNAWHTEVDIRQGNTFCAYVDGNAAADSCVTRPTIGAVDLTGRYLSIGGKLWRPGLTTVGSEDLCYCLFALVRAGTP